MEQLFVWCGGAAFVGSLSLTAWTYAIWFGASRPWGGWSAIVADTMLMTAFALHHSVFARQTVKRRLAHLVPERLLRSVYVWMASLLLIVVCLAWRPIGGQLYRAGGWLAWPCGLVQVVGILLIARSVRAIDALELAGIRHEKRAAGRLQSDGVYRLVRHPLYFGWVLVVFGSAHMTGDRLAFAALTTAYLVMAVPWEEQSLLNEFGPTYERYQARVRWRIVPYVY